jgi:hypothetical protein
VSGGAKNAVSAEKLNFSSARVERQSHTECLLSRCAFSSFQPLRDCAGPHLFPGECLEFTNLYRCPSPSLLSIFHKYLRVNTGCFIWKFSKRKAPLLAVSLNLPNGSC